MSVGDFKSIRKAFTDLADTLSSDFDILVFLELLCGYCSDLLPACAAGVLMAGGHGIPSLVSGSAERTRRLMTAELQGLAGPATDSLLGGCPIRCPELIGALSRWPDLVPQARGAGYHAVDALPLRLRDQTIGALTLYRAAPGPLDDDADELAMAIVDVATIGILHQRALRHEELISQQLQTALDSRIIIEQAKGVLAERLEVAIDEAFRALRRYARNNNMKLTDAARAVAEGKLDIDAPLAEGARERAISHRVATHELRPPGTLSTGAARCRAGRWGRYQVSLVNVRPDARQAPVSVPAKGRTKVGGLVRAYVALTKPRIVELLLITAVPTLFLAYHRLPSLLVTAVVVLGGALAAGSANALNCYIDRDIDEVMRRTRGRPLVKETVSPRAALVFGLVTGALSVVAFAVFTNLLAAALTLGAIAYYVVLYTMVLKRRTPQSTFWGGVCGAAPVLIAWAAATDGLSAAAWLLFAVVFFWQPPHFWALAIKYADDYQRAGIPMLPVVATGRRVLAESVVHSWLMVIASIALWPIAMGPVYGICAVLLGVAFLAEVHGLYAKARRDGELRTMRLFHGSIVYLTLLFAAVGVDSLIR